MKRRYFYIWTIQLMMISGIINISAILAISIPVSHYTGNITQLSHGMAIGDIGKVISIMTYIIPYFIGAMMSGYIFYDKKFTGRKSYGMLLIAFGALTIVFNIFIPEVHMYYFLSFVLGGQNAMFISYKGLLIRSTHITGYLSDAGFTIGQAIRGNKRDMWKANFYIISIIAFVIGGVVGQYLLSFGLYTAIMVIGVLYIIMGVYYGIFKNHLIVID